MIILGISNTKDSGAALIKDNRIIAAANEERFTRQKLIRTFPFHSIKYVLEQGNIELKDVNAITCGAWKGLNENEILLDIVEDIIYKIKNDPSSEEKILERFKVSLETDGACRKELINEIKKLGVSDKLVFIDHHLSHAASAHYCSPFDDSLIFVIDGRGDYKANSVYLAKNNKIKLIYTRNYLNSLGFVYAFATQFLGFTPDKHEGKVTGLAAFGNPSETKKIFKKMLDIDENGKIQSNVGKYYSPFLRTKIPAIEEELSKYSKEDIAAGVQVWLEEIVIKFVSHFLKKFPNENLCLAGGIFANVKLNQKIREINGVKNVYIHPHMGDGGISLGSALAYLYEHSEKIEKPLKNVYLGPEFCDEEIEKELLKNEESIYFYKSRDKIKEVAKMLADNKVVGWFQGRMEYGPRALCNRSILVSATSKDINKILNKRLHRTEFMPFAPVTLEEHADKLYVGWKKYHIASRFMTMCYDCYPVVSKQSPAIVHIDNTARPQIVNKKDNPVFYPLLKEYYKITGIPTIVNTSFNNHEEPIVCTPQDAIESLIEDNIDVLCIGNFIVTKK